MANTYAVQNRFGTLDTTGVNIISAPSSKNNTLRSLHLTNKSGSNVTVDLKFDDGSGNRYYIRKAVSINPNETLVYDGIMFFNATEKLVGIASANTAIDYVASYVEES